MYENSKDATTMKRLTVTLSVLAMLAMLTGAYVLGANHALTPPVPLLLIAARHSPRPGIRSVARSCNTGTTTAASHSRDTPFPTR